MRYSSAKYLSRLSVLLPPSMSSQIVSAVISLFAGSEVDPVVMTDKGKVVDPGGGPGGEGKWHGVCLALAEMARRGLIASDHMSELLPWTIRSLKFDIRRGAHSIGSNVRDAAAYLVWSLARAMSPEDMQPFALDLARTLVTVACLDREVGVRRAASAAFQEHVGRMVSLWYPEGRLGTGNSTHKLTQLFVHAGPLSPWHRSSRQNRLLHGQRSTKRILGRCTTSVTVSHCGFIRNTGSVPG